MLSIQFVSLTSGNIHTHTIKCEYPTASPLYSVLLLHSIRVCIIHCSFMKAPIASTSILGLILCTFAIQRLLRAAFLSEYWQVYSIKILLRENIMSVCC